MFAIMQVETDERREFGRRKMRPKCEFVCKYCQRRFTKPYNLMIHERTHKDDVTFSCEVCGKTFKKQDNLKQHRCGWRQVVVVTRTLHTQYMRHSLILYTWQVYTVRHAELQTIYLDYNSDYSFINLNKSLHTIYIIYLIDLINFFFFFIKQAINVSVLEKKKKKENT